VQLHIRDSIEPRSRRRNGFSDVQLHIKVRAKRRASE